MNADCPEIYCYMRKEFAYDQRKGHGKYIPVCVFGVASIQARAIGFHVITDGGAQFARIPIHGLCWKPCERPILEEVEPWNAFSYDVYVHKFGFLKDLRVRVLIGKGILFGTYLFTIDWYGNNDSEDPGEGGHKNAHVIKLDDGNFSAQPNNRIFWHEASFVTKPYKKKPDFLTNSHVWNSETGRWHADDTNRMFYELKTEKKEKKK